MKLQVVFKTPDAVEAAMEDAEHNCDGPNSCPDCETEEWALYEAKLLTKKFVRHGEYITVEFDTEAGTATVVPIT